MAKKSVPISLGAINEIERNKTLNGLFNKHCIPVDNQNRVKKILAEVMDFKSMEEYYIHGKNNLRTTSKINLDRLMSEVTLLVEKSPSNFLTAEGKGNFLVTFEHFINVERTRRVLMEPIQKEIGKKTAKTIQNNPKDLKVYTKLIKLLVNELNPVFRDPKKDRLMPRSRREEKTFIVVTDIINAVFPLSFTHLQVKSRYHK